MQKERRQKARMPNIGKEEQVKIQTEIRPSIHKSLCHDLRADSCLEKKKPDTALLWPFWPPIYTCAHTHTHNYI